MLVASVGRLARSGRLKGTEDAAGSSRGYLSTPLVPDPDTSDPDTFYGVGRCTQTPLVVWGAGVSESHPARGDAKAVGHSGEGVVPPTPPGAGNGGWGELEHVERKDVLQAQIAPMISALMGAHMPVNNVGTVPLSYLHAPAYSSRPARLLLQNCIQIMRVLELKEALKRKTTFSAIFRPYPPSW